MCDYFDYFVAEQLGTNKWAPITNGGGLNEEIEGEGGGETMVGT